MPDTNAPQEAYRLLSMQLMENYLPFYQGDEIFKEICKDHKSGTTCGHFAHWLLWKIGVQNKEHVNRSEPPDFKYKDGANMGAIVYGKGGHGTTKFTKIYGNEKAFLNGEVSPGAGDICVIQSYVNGAYVTNSDHVFVVYKMLSDDCWEIGQGGTGKGWLNGDRGHFHFTSQHGHIRSKNSGKYLIGWLSLDNLLIGMPR